MSIEIILFTSKNSAIYSWAFDKLKRGLSTRKREELIFTMLKVMMITIKGLLHCYVYLCLAKRATTNKWLWHIVHSMYTSY